eukprot:13431973-Alexandrium_andersonii.AAC.1
MRELAQRAADGLARLQAQHPAAASSTGDAHLMPPPPPPRVPGDLQRADSSNRRRSATPRGAIVRPAAPGPTQAESARPSPSPST